MARDIVEGENCGHRIFIIEVYNVTSATEGEGGGGLGEGGGEGAVLPEQGAVD